MELNYNFMVALALNHNFLDFFILIIRKLILFLISLKLSYLILHEEYLIFDYFIILIIQI